MRALIAATLLIFTSSVASAGELTIPAQGYNCNLSAPPATSGENGLHGLILKIYPRKSDMPASYSGCQTTWLEQGTQWKKIFVSYFEGGTLKMFWSYDDQSPNGILCSYHEGQLAPGAPSSCLEYERVKSPSGSFPPGCMQAMKARKPIPKNCAINENER